MPDQPKQRREYVRFAFYKVDREWRRLPDDERREAVAEVENLYNRYAEGMMIRPYSTVGTRADADLLVWTASHELSSVQELARDFGRTRIGQLSETSHSFLAMTKRSIYLENHVHPGQERLNVKPSKARYLFVYPFVKTREWYLLAKEERQRIMDEHIAIGHKYPGVKINTTYSFGLDDQDFVVAFETNEPADFVDLVMDLRETEGSLFTVRDTPIFTCVAKPISEILADLG
ncbi:MAG TPA: chlorite dismutase family protein [Candidatus Dormibacteraeota bacterium]|nr:chlorite dismutase family protein [Candidatus Dormibacteraeota bacterium]